MKAIAFAIPPLLFSGIAAAQPVCDFNTAPNAPACQATSSNLQPTDILLGQQANGPNRPNQTVKVPVSQIGGLPLTGGTVSGPTTFTVGHVDGPWTTSTRPSSPSTGTTGYNSTIGSYETWNGTAWVSGTITLSALTALILSLPTTLPSSSGVLWLNGGLLAVSQ